ncbi:hypothetical protein JTE90_016976 [Oedothorax gibbosus]|uniref:Mannosyltransferase n=1 Tax=Oedothorax gibbosus TaxID=931172 RepID=A0AAV6UH90_9ARAC|nr:hypothetical protein JTE90_016976 [Oedothorax gibbosus]
MPPRSRIKSKRDSIKDREIKDNAPTVSLLSEPMVGRAWTPSFYTAFKILLSARVCAAVWSNISDCDEVYNYWEPMHFLLHGKGFQTWEYSPLYAIRSYAYLWLHAMPCFVYSLILQSNRILVFYYMRCLFALVSALCEVCFYRAVCQHFGNNVGRLTLLFLTMSSGMFVSSTAFLPSTCSMYLSTLAFAAWFLKNYEVAVFATAISTLVGWPFAAVLGLPIAYDILLLKKEPMLFIKTSLASLFLILVPLIYVDSRQFGKLVVAPLNIILYNVFTSHGPDLYGTEPCTFYFLNGILNFNIVFLAALVSIPALLILRCFEGTVRKTPKSPPIYLCLTPMYLWMFVFFPLAHKEERFLFPIYPMICLAGASAVDTVQKLYHKLFSKRKFGDYLDATSGLSMAFCALFCIASLSRTIIVYRGYRAPIETFMQLGQFSLEESLHPLPPEYPVNICVGKEWYRFPSSFFLPDNWNLKFLKSEFKGQLPKPFEDSPNATRIIPTEMNDQNLEERSRYVDIKACDYIVDSDFPNHSSLEPRYSKDPNWNITFSLPFLDSQRSHTLLRAFYVPYFTDFLCNYVDYNLLQRANIRDRLVRKRRKPGTHKRPNN